MKLSDNELDILVLKRAKEKVAESYSRRFLCHVIPGVCENMSDPDKFTDSRVEQSGKRLVKWINKMLLERIPSKGGEIAVNGVWFSPSIEVWIAKKHPQLLNGSDHYSNHPDIHEKMKETRLAWLDWMIAECEKELVK